MTKSVVSPESIAPAKQREPRPFLFLEPIRAATSSEVNIDDDAVGLLDAAAASSIPAFVRSLVNYTIALQNRRALEHGDVQPIQLSVLNRRRRAARAWVNSILAGKIDAATCHTVATQWLPTLCGTGPDIDRCIKPASRILEFVRGAVTATVFSDPANNLVPHAKALNVLESVLAVHLAAVRQAAKASTPVRGS